MQKYQLGLYEKSMPFELSFEEKLTCVGENGFDYLEISIDESSQRLHRLDKASSWRHQLAEAVYATGVPIRSMCLSGHRKYPLGSRDPAIRDKSLEIARKAVEFAADLGVRTIQLAGYDVYYETHGDDTEKYFSQNLCRVLETAAEYGVILAFETMETPFMDTVLKAIRYVEKVNSPYLQVYPDIGNLTNSSRDCGVSAADQIRQAKGHLAAVHLKETVPGKYREIPFGTGSVDFPSCIAAAMETGARMFVGEFWYTGGNDFKKDLASASKFLRESFKTIG